MKARGRTARLATGLALLAALLVAWAFFSIERPRRLEEQRRDSKERVFAFAPATVRELRLSRGGTETILLRTGGGWTVTAGATFDADAGAVEAYLASLAAIHRNTSVPLPRGALAGFGLDPPRVRISVALADGRRLSLEVGADNPFDGTLFARSAGDVLVLPAGARATLAVDPSSFRVASAPDGGNRG